MRVLVQKLRRAQGQFQDRIINWNPGPKDTVLIEADERIEADDLPPAPKSSETWAPTRYPRCSNSTS